MAEKSKIFMLAEQLKAAKDKKKELEDMVDTITAEIEKLDKQLSDEMAKEECPNFTHNGSTFYLTSRLYASPKAGGKEALFAALRAKGFGDMIKEGVNANSLSSFVKEQRELNKEEIPEWIAEVVNTFEKITVGITKV